MQKDLEGNECSLKAVPVTVVNTYKATMMDQCDAILSKIKLDLEATADNPFSEVVITVKIIREG